MNRMTRWIASGMLVTAMAIPLAVPAMAQNRNGFYNGARDRHLYNDNYDRRRYHDDRRNQGGIGPGKGALIGGAGGAALGALFGGGLKGTLIGGAAGAGVGAIAGKVHQDNKRRDYRERYDRYGRPY
jgi:outer membrane lipoprotein SlyB